MQQPDRRAPLTAGHPSSRRRAVRLEAPANLTVELTGKQIDVQVVDIGAGGLGLVTSRAIERGASYIVGLRLGDVVVSCGARAAHCRRRDDGRWVVGLAFVQDERLEMVERIVDAITRDLIQFS